jgi:subtilisin family serine protease
MCRFNVWGLAATLAGAAVLIAFLSPFIHAEAEPGPLVRLVRASFDPLLGAPDFPEDLTLQAYPDGGSGVYAVQFEGPIQASWKDELSRLGIQWVDYVPEYAFLAWMDGATAARAAVHPHVRWVGLYQPAYRLSPRLDGAAGVQTVALLTLPTVDEADLSARLQVLGASVHHVSLNGFGGHVRLTVDAAQIPALARLPEVIWVEPYVPPRLVNDVARGEGIMDATAIWRDLGLYGEGQIVAVCDSGLDVGVNDERLHDDFEGRVVALYDLDIMPGDGADDRCSGHGTHVAGSVLGNGATSGSDPANHDYASGYAGLAPEARLVFQAVEWAALPPDICLLSGLLSGDLDTLYQQAYDDGARIHTNSWTSPVNGEYTAESQKTDQFAWNNKDFTLLFAAGNEGIDTDADGVVDLDSVGAPATAKNCITVGASENNRPVPSPNPDSNTYGALWHDKFPTRPISDDLTADVAFGLAAFSSRGPTDDGRIKPDIVAPGTWVLSAYSQANHPDDDGNQYDGWGDPPNRWYKYMGGTSMATPLTAGAATLVRDYYNDIAGLATPSSALIKATLINGAKDLTPGQYGSGDQQEILGRPDYAQGWGRVDLANALIPEAPRAWWYDDHSAGLSTNDTVTYTDSFSTPLGVGYDTESLRVSLVWTDYPGTPAAGGLVNDLDLEVIGPDGTRYYGNGSAWDRANNVEGVDILTPTLGAYTLIVHAYNVAQETQPYALVVSGGFGETPCLLPSEVDFDWAPQPVYVDAVTHLTATVSSTMMPLTYTWQFGDDASQVIDWAGVVSHTFSLSGTHPVTLSVANRCGAAEPLVRWVDISRPQSRQFLYLPLVLKQ